MSEPLMVFEAYDEDDSWLEVVASDGRLVIQTDGPGMYLETAACDGLITALQTYREEHSHE